eukprot:snap_masked-scaffold_17-processed-gene-6.35-mRNA-1 protein AED:1.00 eAED:1.00 QI:0/0/0/0/1/1/2/0/67
MSKASPIQSSSHNTQENINRESTEKLSLQYKERNNITINSVRAQGEQIFQLEAMLANAKAASGALLV